MFFERKPRGFALRALVLLATTTRPAVRHYCRESLFKIMERHSRHVLFGDSRRSLPQFKSILGNLNSVQQRSRAWFALRRGALSGSQLSSLLYARTAKTLDKLWRQAFENAPRSPLNEQGRANCAWGQKHEQDACNWLLERASDAFIFDVSFQQHPQQKWLGASADGLVYSPALCPETFAVLECKCPAKQVNGRTVPYDCVPPYYVPQCYLEMRSMPFPVKHCIFVCWSETECRAWRLDFEINTWLTL